jgi:uncharacterized membrane protein
MQSKKASLIEAIVNTFIGFLITCAVAPIIYWIVDVKMSAVSLGLTNLLFTLVSVIRNYVIRRVFNRTGIFTLKPKKNEKDNI